MMETNRLDKTKLMSYYGGTHLQSFFVKSKKATDNLLAGDTVRSVCRYFFMAREKPR